MTLMTSSMLPRLLGVMSGKLIVRGGCVRCRHDGVRVEDCAGGDKGKMRTDAVAEDWMLYVRQSDDFIRIAVMMAGTNDRTRFYTSSVQSRLKISVESGFADMEAMQYIACGLATQRCISKHISSFFLY